MRTGSILHPSVPGPSLRSASSVLSSRRLLYLRRCGSAAPTPSLAARGAAKRLARFRSPGAMRAGLGVVVFAAVFLLAGGAARAENWLWQLGVSDSSAAEFALGPGGYAAFAEDGFHVIGQGDPKQDWPYVHPGPEDGWAGNRQHAFSLVFGLRRAPAEGACRLRLALVDTHGRSAPELEVEINGQRQFARRLPAGGGDASVGGQTAQAKAFQVDVDFPSALLRIGQNTVTLRTLSGSWFLYDWIGLEAPAGGELAPTTATVVSSVSAPRALVKAVDGAVRQPVRVVLRHQGDAATAEIRVDTGAVTNRVLQPGVNSFELLLPAVDRETAASVSIALGGRPVVGRSVMLKPVRRLTVYILPHSHTDIGYTEIQSEIEDKQVENLRRGIAFARQTAGNPPGARFVWNVEVLWAADLYRRRLGEVERREFLEALKRGQISLNAMYLNELTGLCRPEELVRLFRLATELGDETGTRVDSAMISDVPGYTWGLVTAMNQAGVRYFSTAPNYFDRIGDILVQWENKPFYWVGPDGRSEVLVWIPYKGYAMSHVFRALTPEFVEDYQAQLDRTDYPYEIAYMRWSGHGDNAVPDPAICDFVKSWNASHEWPHFVISSTSDAFRAFEAKYGARLPRVAGDWTPYWEDGAGSSALETALNRASSDRLSQAEALYAMRQPAVYPRAAFEDAWRDVLLYSEHTWGAWCSVSEPARRETREQWAVKQSYAAAADLQSRDLLSRGLALGSGAVEESAVDVVNTASWPRTDLVVVPKFLSEGGDRVTDAAGAPVASQRLHSGELVLLAREVPGFGAKRFRIATGAPHQAERVSVQGTTLDNGRVRVRLDSRTGAIVELRLAGLEANFASEAADGALNDYLYFNGDNPADAQRNGPVTLTVGETGPLVASLLVESAAPGCHRLLREVRLVAGSEAVELINTVDKQRLVASGYHAKEGKESLNFAFPFSVPDGQVRLEVPFGVVRPDADQIPSACKNWFTVGRWADVANADFGVTWVTLDAPLVQVGGLTANLLNSQANPAVWRKEVGPTQRLYSWAMNNHWGTNYRAHQEGAHVFRFLLRPHRGYDPMVSSRLAIGASQPLLPTVARGRGDVPPRLRISSDAALVTALKPSDDGKGLILRLWGASGSDVRTSIEWAEPVPKRLWLSDTSEKPLTKVSGPVVVPAWGLVTLRAELRR